MKRSQSQRFDLSSADPDHATLATQLKWPFNMGGSTWEVHLYTKCHFWNDQVASHRRLAAPKSGGGGSQQVVRTTVLPIILLYSHFLKPYSDIIC